MHLGTVTAIRRFPVKSLAGEALEETPVEADGLPGDRASSLVVRTGHARIGKTYRGKENDRLHTVSSGSKAVELARTRGVDVTLESGDRYFDDAPVSLLIDRWMDGLSAALGYRVEPERFRTNFLVAATEGFALEEDDLTGRELALGNVRLRVRYPIERCVATTYAPDGSGNDARVLRYIAQHRSSWMGIYCDVTAAGIVRIGDELSAIEGVS